MHKSVDIEILDYACLTNYVYENKLFITVFDILISDFNILKLSKSRRLCFFIVSLNQHIYGNAYIKNICICVMENVTSKKLPTET